MNPKKAKKRIDENYRWRYPTIIDRSPEFLEYLKTKPLYEDALYVRKGELFRMEQRKVGREYAALNGLEKREELDLGDLKSHRPLKLV